MTHAAADNNLFEIILSDLKDVTLRLTLRAPSGETFEVQGVNAGDRVIDGEGREWSYRDHQVEEIH